MKMGFGQVLIQWKTTNENKLTEYDVTSKWIVVASVSYW